MCIGGRGLNYLGIPGDVIGRYCVLHLLFHLIAVMWKKKNILNNVRTR
jgi:hypothetical protein